METCKTDYLSGKTKTLKELNESGQLTYLNYDIPRDEYNKYYEQHKDEDYIQRYIKYC
jgi:hypothetical protein